MHSSPKVLVVGAVAIPSDRRLTVTYRAGPATNVIDAAMLRDRLLPPLSAGRYTLRSRVSSY